MTQDQFAIWLQGYLSVNIYNAMSRGATAVGADVQKMGSDVLTAAWTVEQTKPTQRFAGTPCNHHWALTGRSAVDGGSCGVCGQKVSTWNCICGGKRIPLTNQCMCGGRMENSAQASDNCEP